MYKLVLILVVSLIVCEANVTKLSMKIGNDMGNDVASNMHTMKVYCAGARQVARCFLLPKVKSYYFEHLKASYQALAVAFIYKNADCSYDTEKMKGFVTAFVLMADCNDLELVNMSEDGTQIEVQYVNSKKYELCTKNECTVSPTQSLTTKTAWKLESHPTQRNRYGAVFYCDKMYSCGSCTTTKLCAPSKDKKFYEVSSGSCKASAPYCQYATGSCSDTVDPACMDYPNNVKTDDFICMRDGYFPDPLDCTKFYTCKGKVAYVHSCPSEPTPYYHPGLKYCVASPDFCTHKTSTIYCNNEKYFGKKVPILFTNDKLFMDCSVGTKPEVRAIDRCIGGYKFDKDTEECKFSCPHHGFFLNKDDCTKYFSCVEWTMGKMKEEVISCDPGLGFSEKEYACVDKSKVPNCQEEHPDFFNK